MNSNLPAQTPATPDPVDWRAVALCAQIGGEIFFPELGGPAEPARRICRRCPALDECLDYALAEDVQGGVFGAMTGEERRTERARRAALAADESAAVTA